MQPTCPCTQGVAQSYVGTMTRIVVLCVLLLLPGGLFGQTVVQGRVAGPAGDAVTAVTMSLSNGRVTHVTATDSLGLFAFMDVLPGEYKLVAQRIGYVLARRTLSVRGAPLGLEVALAEQPIALESVTVEGERARTRFRNEAGVTTRELSKAELKLIPGLAEADVLRAIEVLPGVVSTSDLSSAYNVRGGSADQNLIMLDGIPIFNPFHLGGIFSIFNSDFVERAELMAGGFSAEYGGRVSSVLNVISDVGSGTFNVNGGISLLATRLSVAGGLSEERARRLGISSARFRLGGRRSYFDQLLKPLFDFPYHLTDLQFAGEVFVNSTSRLSASAYVGNDVLQFAGLDSFPLQLNWQWGNTAAGAAWTKTLANSGSIEVRSSYSRFSTNILFPDFGDTRFVSRIDQALLHSRATLPLGRSQLKFGAELNRLWYSNRAEAGGSVFRKGSEVGWQPSVYAQLSLKPSADWLIETGLREDVWRAESGAGTISEPVPRLAIKRFFADGDAAVKVALGRYTQFLHSLRDEEFPIGIDVWVLTGLRAPHVVSDQVQAGVEWFPSTGWYAALETYSRKFKGVATNNFADDPNTDADDLLAGKGLSYGADAVLRKDDGALRGFVTVSWLRAWREFPDFLSGIENAPAVRYPPIFDRRLELDMVLRLRLPRGWESGVRWNYGSGLPFTRPIGSYRIIDYRLSDDRRTLQDSSTTAVLLEPRNASRYPAYHRLDLSFNKTFQKGWGTLSPHLDILNLYNRRNVLFYFYDYAQTPAVRAGASMFPFLPTIGVEVAF